MMEEKDGVNALEGKKKCPFPWICRGYAAPTPQFRISESANLPLKKPFWETESRSIPTLLIKKNEGGVSLRA
jgi:hypothetical protein